MGVEKRQAAFVLPALGHPLGRACFADVVCPHAVGCLAGFQRVRQSYRQLARSCREVLQSRAGDVDRDVIYLAGLAVSQNGSLSVRQVVGLLVLRDDIDFGGS